MRKLRALAIGSLVTGLALLAAGVACSGGDDDDHQEFNNQTQTATPSATNTLTPSPTATPTPTPFDGKVSRMAISELGIDYPIEDIGIDEAKNQLETPKDATGAIGWYHPYPKPGFGKNSVYSAHVNYNGKDGPFARLSKAKAGTQVTIQMTDGPTYTYEVFANERYTIENIPMGELIDRTKKPSNEEWITLITCSCEPGRILDPDGDGFGECLDRDVITARRIS